MPRNQSLAYVAAALMVVVFVLWLTGILHWPQTQRVANVSQPERLVFRTSARSPSGVTLRVRGHIDGTASITTVEAPWTPHQIAGDVDWSVYHDWFNSTCSLDYSPAHVASGHLKLELTFH